jgi:uncharacterized protein YbaR (Trm112 family)
MMDTGLLKILCCPETRQPLHLAETAMVDELNRQIPSGGVKNRAGQPVKKNISGGLVRVDGKFLYPIRGNIPVLLVDEAIPLAS